MTERIKLKLDHYTEWILSLLRDFTPKQKETILQQVSTRIKEPDEKGTK